MIKKDVISLEAQWYAGGYKFIMFENNIGIFAFEYGHGGVVLRYKLEIEFSLKLLARHWRFGFFLPINSPDPQYEERNNSNQTSN